MMSRRPFRPGTLDGHATILDLAQKNRKQYDEKILKALVYTLSVYPVGTAVLLSNNGPEEMIMKTDSAHAGRRGRRRSRAAQRVRWRASSCRENGYGADCGRSGNTY